MKTHDVLNILSAEDDLDDQLLIREAIKAAGITAKIEFVEDGEDLIRSLLDGDDKDRPDIILLDLNMPKVDGRQALEEIRNQSRIKDIPIVVLTTSKDQEDINTCHRLGVDSFFTKPKLFNELVDIIKGLTIY